MIYLNDALSPLNTSLVARQVPQCFAYDEWGSRGVHAVSIDLLSMIAVPASRRWLTWGYYSECGPWHAMTPCQSSNASSSGGYLTYTEGDSIGHSYDGG